MQKIRDVVRSADLVSSTYSYTITRPFEFPALMYAAQLGKKTICVVDIDNRDSAKMNF
ncbi:MAG: hypothetical protein R3A47_05120 [Polyangiales bacterium]